MKKSIKTLMGLSSVLITALPVVMAISCNEQKVNGFDSEQSLQDFANKKGYSFSKDKLPMLFDLVKNSVVENVFSGKLDSVGDDQHGLDDFAVILSNGSEIKQEDISEENVRNSSAYVDVLANGSYYLDLTTPTMQSSTYPYIESTQNSSIQDRWGMNIEKINKPKFVIFMQKGHGDDSNKTEKKIIQFFEVVKNLDGKYYLKGDWDWNSL